MNKSSAISAYLAAVVIACVLISSPTVAAPAEAATAKASSLEEAMMQGEQIFASDRFGSTRTFGGQPATCTSCHTNNGKTEGVMPNGSPLPSLVGVAATFPKFSPRKHQVITLEEQLMGCIKGGLQGQPPAYNSPQMVDLITYLTSLSKGSVMGKQF
jgi:thiosulfate dehydrogenase